MLDIPELDDMVCRQLSPHDLAQCARVSKKWWSIVAPHIWGDLSWLYPTYGASNQLSAFHRIILKDYLDEQRQQESQEERHDVEQPTPSHPRWPILSKYGHWIRTLPNPRMDCSSFHVALIRQEKAPKAYELFLYFFNHCSPDVQVGSLIVHCEDMDKDPRHPWRTILDLTLPRVQHLHITNITNTFRHCQSDTSTVMTLLDQCSTTLEKLTLNIHIPQGDGKDDRDGEPTENEPKGLTSLKELVLSESKDNSDTKKFWPWLWKRCGSIEKIMVNRSPVTVQNLAQGMLAYMPNLSEVILGEDWGTSAVITDDMTAKLLSGSRNGWKVVRVSSNVRFGRSAMDALEAHFPTLEVLGINGDNDSSNCVIEALKSCAKLRTLTITNCFESGSGVSSFSAKVFIDQDHDTGSLKTWNCEASLRVLDVHIVDIPRLYQQSDPTRGILSDQGREIQNLVYERLARLTNLETLCLGTKGSQGLGMSLESGLEKLSGLKKLKALNIRKMMGIRLGLKELRWMAENWPKLRVIDGFQTAAEKEAKQWMLENYPQVEVR